MEIRRESDFHEPYEKKNKRGGPDLDFLFLIFISAVIFFCCYKSVFAKEVCPIKLDDKTVARIPVTLRGTVLNFPVKPSKVILGKTGSFGIEYVESDLAISPLSASSRSNLFVYLQGRRFTFDLFTESTSGCTVVSVRDALEIQTRVDFEGK